MSFVGCQAKDPDEVAQADVEGHRPQPGGKGPPVGAYVGLDEAVEELHRPLQRALDLAGAVHAEPTGERQGQRDQGRHHNPGHYHRLRHRDAAQHRDGKGHLVSQLLHQGFLECIQTHNSHHLVFAWAIILPAGRLWEPF